jgi:hypothetical protein
MVNKMNCNQLAGSLDRYLDRDLPDADRTVLDRHVQDCAICQGLLAREQRMRRALRQLPVPEPGTDFYRRAMAGATQPARPARLAHWKVGATAAIAASLATWFMVPHISDVTVPQAEAPVATVTMAMNETRTIHLVFNSRSGIDDARLRLQLPPGIELANHGDRREFRWKTRLRPGNNTMPLELVVRDGAGGDLIAQLSHAGDQKTFRVKVTIFTRSNNA